MPFCKYCGKEITTEAQFCPNCGAAVIHETTTMPVAERSPKLKYKPFGVTILVVLEALVSLLTLVGGIALVAIAAILAAGGLGIMTQQELSRILQNMPWASGFTGLQLISLTTTILAVMGVVILVMSILGFIMAWGLWAGKRWAWTITIILSALGVLTNLFTLPGSIISILINGGIIYYLTRPYVKNYYR